MPPNEIISKSSCWLLIIALGGCTTTHTYNLNQINSELPIEIGDEVKIYEKDFGRQYRIIVTAVSEETIKGKLVVDPERITTVRWDEISRLELKQSDNTATAGLVALLLVLLLAVAYAAADATDNVNDTFEDAFDAEEDE